MKYDFESIIDRHNMDALAVDGVGCSWGPEGPEPGYDLIPMWVADMNFKTAPSITEAIAKRLEHPLFGYFYEREEYYSAIISWQEKRNGVKGLKPCHIGYENGVLGGVISALNAICTRGDEVLVHAPTYVGFTHALYDNGYNIVHSYLKPDDKGILRMDYDDMEQKLKAGHIHAAILCSPHNPCGRVWERWELEKAMELYRRYDVYVISDEIWSDIILEGNHHIPTQSISEDARRRTIAFYAVSKTFNLAGLIGSYHIIYDDWLRDRVTRAGAQTHYNSCNVLSQYALIGGYSPAGEEWVDELCHVITGNVEYTMKYIDEHFEGVTYSRPQGTYMLFVDFTGWCRVHGVTIDELEHRFWAHGVAVQDGVGFHGPCHIRMNLALPLSRVKEALERMNEVLK